MRIIGNGVRSVVFFGDIRQTRYSVQYKCHGNRLYTNFILCRLVYMYHSFVQVYIFILYIVYIYISTVIMMRTFCYDLKHAGGRKKEIMISRQKPPPVDMFTHKNQFPRSLLTVLYIPTYIYSVTWEKDRASQFIVKRRWISFSNQNTATPPSLWNALAIIPGKFIEKNI